MKTYDTNKSAKARCIFLLLIVVLLAWWSKFLSTFCNEYLQSHLMSGLCTNTSLQHLKAEQKFWEQGESSPGGSEPWAQRCGVVMSQFLLKLFMFLWVNPKTMEIARSSWLIDIYKNLCIFTPMTCLWVAWKWCRSQSLSILWTYRLYRYWKIHRTRLQDMLCSWGSLRWAPNSDLSQITFFQSNLHFFGQQSRKIFLEH